MKDANHNQEISAAQALQEELRGLKELVRANIQHNLVSHSMNNALVSIRYRLRLSREALREENPQYALECLEAIDKTLTDIAELERATFRRPEVETIDVGRFLLEFAASLRNSYSDLQIDVHSDPLLRLLTRANPQWLREVVYIIVDNAVKAMESRPRKVLGFATAIVGDNLEIHIRDTGKGVGPDLSERLFREPIKDETRTVPGVGLLLASIMIQTFGGSVSLASSDSDGSVFVISLPKS